MKNNFICSSVALDDRTGWNQLLIDTEVSIYFHWEYLDAIKDNYPNGINLVKVFNEEGGVIIMYTSRSKDGVVWDIYSPYAMDGIFTWGTNSLEIMQTLNNFLHSKRIVTYFLYVYPNHFKSDSTFFFPTRTVYFLDLSNSIEQLWQNLHPNHRYEINRFNKDVHEFVEDKNQLIVPFCNLYSDTLQRVKASEVYNFNRHTLEKLINLDFSFTLGVRINGEIECIVHFVKWGENADYFINASSEIGRSASRTLMWEALKRLKTKGVLKINLGGGIQEGDNLDNFKRRFGGSKNYLGIFKGISSTEDYERLCIEANVSIIAKDYFPPYWSKKNG